MQNYYNTIIEALKVSKLLTEHELVACVAKKVHKTNFDIQPLIGSLLEKLRFDGLIWCGELTNSSEQKMWAACLTEKGKLQAKYGSTTESSASC